MSLCEKNLSKIVTQIDVGFDQINVSKEVMEKIIDDIYSDRNEIKKYKDAIDSIRDVCYSKEDSKIPPMQKIRGIIEEL